METLTVKFTEREQDTLNDIKKKKEAAKKIKRHLLLQYALTNDYNSIWLLNHIF